MISADARSPSVSASSSAAPGDLARQVGHVVALVAVLGHRFVARAGPDGGAELGHLRARVVEVVLAHDLVAGELEQPRQRVAVGGVTAGGGGQRAGRVGRDELDDHALGALRRAAAPVGARGDDLSAPRRRTRSRPGRRSGSRGRRPRRGPRRPRAARSAAPRAARRSRAAARPARARAASPRWSSSPRTRPSSGAPGSPAPSAARCRCGGRGRPPRRPPATGRSGARSMMVRLTGQDLVRSVELLEQHDARQQVRERRRPEAQRVVGVRELGPERAADHEAHVAARLAALLEPVGERLGRVGAPAAVEQADPRAVGIRRCSASSSATSITSTRA